MVREAGAGTRKATWSCAMTEFRRVPDSADSSGSFALPRSPAGGPTGGLCHSTRFTSGPTAPSAFAISARRVLQVLPGLLYLTAYPSPMSILARSMAQRNHPSPPVALLHAESHRRVAWRFESLRTRSSRRGRSSSMTHSNGHGNRRARRPWNGSWLIPGAGPTT